MTGARPAAIVTGGSRGIGLGIASMLAGRGWNVTITARGAEALNAAAAELSSTDATVQGIPGDLGDGDFAAELLQAHRARFGSLDALVLAAGVGSAAPIDGYPDRRLHRQLDVNFRAPFRLVALALPELRASARARGDAASRVIAISSLEGDYPEGGLAAYGATKAALTSLMASINEEERANGVLATAIAPGYVDTAMSDWVADVIPKATMLEVADIVRSVAYLLDLSPQAVVPHIAIHRRAADAYRA